MNGEKLKQENEATIASLNPAAAPLVRQILSKGHIPYFDLHCELVV